MKISILILFFLGTLCQAAKDYCFFCAKPSNPYIDYCYQHHRDSVVTGTDVFVDAMSGAYSMRDPIPQALMQQTPMQQVGQMYNENAFISYPEIQNSAPLQSQSVINPTLLQPLHQAPPMERKKSNKKSK